MYKNWETIKRVENLDLKLAIALLDIESEDWETLSAANPLFNSEKKMPVPLSIIFYLYQRNLIIAKGKDELKRDTLLNSQIEPFLTDFLIEKGIIKKLGIKINAFIVQSSCQTTLEFQRTEETKDIPLIPSNILTQLNHLMKQDGFPIGKKVGDLYFLDYSKHYISYRIFYFYSDSEIINDLDSKDIEAINKIYTITVSNRKGGKPRLFRK